MNFSDFTIYDCIGLAGVSLTLFAYARLQWRRDYARQAQYSLLNLASAFLLGISLTQKWNTAAFINNFAWGGISIYGTYRCLKYHHKIRKKKHVS